MIIEAICPECVLPVCDDCGECEECDYIEPHPTDDCDMCAAQAAGLSLGHIPNEPNN
jgi:hypothetical protein